MDRIWPIIVAATLLCLTGPSIAEEFGCSPDLCIEQINAIVQKVNPSLVTAKQSCTEEGGARRCNYRSKVGPGINLISKNGSDRVQAMVIVDKFGLSPAGGIYIHAIMEAFDTSLDAAAREKFYNKMLGDFAVGFQKGGTIQMESGELKYGLDSFTDRSITMFGVSHTK